VDPFIDLHNCVGQKVVMLVLVSRSGLAVSMSSYETTGPGSILGVAIFRG